MPTALSTTKRKFHRILDSISNASSTSLATNHSKYNASTNTLPGSMDPPTKKARLARPTSAYLPPGMRTIAAPSSTMRPATAPKQQLTSSGLGNEDCKSPNFAPWDRAQFLARLETYRHVDKWMSKPESISEVQWAKRGWSCVGKETVRCVGGCENELVIKLESREQDKGNEDAQEADKEADEEQWRETAQDQLIEKYAEMIVTWHDGGCLWRRRGCDDTIQRLPLAHRATAIENLRQRYQSLLVMASELPPDPSTPVDFDISNIHARVAPLICSSPLHSLADDGRATIPTSSNPTDNAASPLPVRTAALTLALFGWQAVEGHISGLATCTACFRRLGFWLFKSSTDPTSQSSMNRLDVIGEHRDYCPWVNALSQTGTASRRTSLDGLAGWEVLVRAVVTGAQYTKSDSEEMSNAAIELEDAASDIGSVTSSTTKSRDRKEEEYRDKERWAKLKRLKQVFNVKKGKGKEAVTKQTKDVIHGD